ncbi:MAG: cytochrome c, partial [Candidatus Scalindua sp.]
MREFLIAFMLALAVAFMAGGTQAIAEKKAETEVASKTELVLTPEQFESSRQVYFDRCAGCHGVLRKGATGPNLTPAQMIPKGNKKLRDMLWYGTAKGMPGWGKMGVMTAEETDLMVKYIQNEPPIPPQWDMKKVKDSWKVLIPVDKRPTKPEHNRDIDNMFGVVL